jgi:NADPH-dependent 2,4-dienoyl-CoA reductase/sulfur reductase-like enzyme
VPAPPLPPDAAVVVVGAGLGGLTVVEQLRAAGHAGPLTLVGSEAEHPYDRPPLSKEALRGGAGPAHLRPPAEYAELGLDLRLGRTATGVDVARRQVQLDDGAELGYDALVLAPGAVPRTLPVLAGQPAVHVLRTHADAQALRADVLSAGRLAVVGGGFVGCEVASSARALRAEVDLVELLPGPLVRVLGPRLAARVADLHRDAGVRLHVEAAVTGVRGQGADRVLLLDDGSEVGAPVVLVGLGVVPATGWLSGVELDADGAVRCDGVGRTGTTGVWALGDAASWAGPDGARVRHEHWTSALEQAACVAAALLDPSTPAHAPVPYVWSEQHGVLLQCVGAVEPQTEAELHDAPGGVVALHAAGDRLAGVALLDGRRLVGRARRLLRDGASLDEARAALLG